MNIKSLENKTKSDCEYYNWGGEGTKERPTYPLSYGSRCEFYKKFFSIKEDILNPQCYRCKNAIK